MGIYIKGMEMPVSCWCCDPDFAYAINCNEWKRDDFPHFTTSRPDTCPLIESADAVPLCDDCTECTVKALNRPSAEAVSRESYTNAVGYVKWLEKLIVEAETFEWLCEDATDSEWCEKNCNYASIQTECLWHLYEVSKGGDAE